MQRKMARDINFVRDNLAVRIGLHHGDALEENGDVYGDAVNTAARMASLAKREQIVTTAATVNGVDRQGAGNARPGPRPRQRQAAADRDRRRGLAGRHFRHDHGAERDPASATCRRRAGQAS